ncbi:MAG: peptidoglycan-binding protein [Acetobacteraceae bacterium]
MYARGDQVEGFPDVVLATQPEPRRPARRPNPALVRDVQGELMRLDYLQTPPDGSLGPKTKSAILAFERAHGMRPSANVSNDLLDRLQSTPSNGTQP